MVQGPLLLVLLAIAIALIVALISRYKVHAFLSSKKYQAHSFWMRLFVFSCRNLATSGRTL
ncbi:hypothetical protein AXX12_02590 [Anaerosporomusa subterranea]|uniref:Uncharacterized protein n=1 Tax=Anaerosporomusa subterranea TaxID=1794912 RepID=A0A154BSU5_ANASB|nr:hypothetical protein [Anaerosporomusa subterranea]KYZ77046.1 hypothetical protein AXX12_02590 [Anaerosporomusa subterranea]